MTLLYKSNKIRVCVTIQCYVNPISRGYHSAYTFIKIKMYMELENLIQWRCLVIDKLYFIILGLIIGIIAGYFIRRYIGEGKIKNAEELAKKITEDAEKEIRERRNEVQKLERRVLHKEETLDRKSDSIEKKEEQINKKNKYLEEKEEAINELYLKQTMELERLSGLTTEEAKELILNDIRKEVAHESAIMIKEMESKAKEEAEDAKKKAEESDKEKEDKEGEGE